MPTPTKYTYTISSDFPSGSLREENLISEIQETGSITISLDWDSGAVNRVGDVCNIWFLDTLPVTSSLDAVVAAHDDVPYNPPDQIEGSVSLSGVLQIGRAHV